MNSGLRSGRVWVWIFLGFILVGFFVLIQQTETSFKTAKKTTRITAPDLLNASTISATKQIPSVESGNFEFKWSKQCEVKLIGNPDIAQNDSRLVNYIRNFYITPPSVRPYDLKLANDPENNPSEYAEEIMNLFQHKKNGGFFIEAGANDGEYLSNTLQLEREYHWTGLLIEPNPFMLAKLRLRYRKAWIAGLGLSLEGYPQKVRFMHHVSPEYPHGFQGLGIIEHSEDNPIPPQTQRNPKDYIYAGPVECFPLYSILLALNQTLIDYFSLDIEGIELRVLKSIPFDLVKIKVFSIEYNLIPEGEQVLQTFLESKGYLIIFKINVEMFAVHKDFLHEFEKSQLELKDRPFISKI